MRERRPVTEPTKCRSCGQDVLWVLTSQGKRMPVNAVADNRPAPKGGTVVLSLRGGEHGELVAEKYNPRLHGLQRNRYTSHFATCPQAGEWRRGR